MGLKVAIQMDPVERINIDADSTFALALEGQRRGHRLWHYLVQDLSFAHGRVRTRARALRMPGMSLAFTAVWSVCSASAMSSLMSSGDSLFQTVAPRTASCAHFSRSLANALLLSRTVTPVLVDSNQSSAHALHSVSRPYV